MSLRLGKLKFDTVDYAVAGNAILGIRGSGKSFTATNIAEQLFDAGIPFIAFDPIGQWRFMRIPGRGKGYPVVVAGGREGDLPLTVASAPEIVRSAMCSGISLVIDLFDINLSKADWKRIVTGCVRVLLHENAEHGLRHIFVEEASEFCPQRVGPDQGHVYAEIEKLARMGGNARLGYTLINQRAEEVNKAVLELCDNLFLHRQKGRNSLTALSKWLDIGAVKASKSIVDTLSTLPTGECWAWMAGSETPELIKVQEKNSLHPDRRTMRDAKDAKIKSAVDVGAFVEDLRKNLVAFEAESDANDPAKLKAKIRELESRLARQAFELEKKQAAPAAGFDEGYRAAIDECAASFAAAKSTLASAVADQIARAEISWPRAKAKMSSPKDLTGPPQKVLPLTLSGSARSGLTGAQERVVDALGFWAGIGNSAPTRAQVAAVSGYSVKSSGFEKTLSQLSTLGIVSRPSGGLLALIDTRQVSRMSAETARAKLIGILGPAQRRVLNAFNGTSASKEEIAERSQYSVTSSGFEKTLSQLSSIGVVTRPAPGMVDLSDWVREIL